MANDAGKMLTDLAGDLLGGGKLDLGSILDSASGLLGGGTKFPTMSAANWSKLIARFRSNVPENITTRWLVNALDVSQSTVESSVLPSLELMGIVRKDGKSTRLADSLGSESGYRAAVAKILKAEYPEELLAMDYSTKSAQSKIQSWFERASGESESKAKTMANLYLTLRKEYDEGDSAASTSSSSSTSKRKDGGVSLTVKINFNSKAQASAFVDLFGELAQELKEKLAKL